MTKLHPISVAYGDGIGPEIMHATLAILDKAGAKLAIHPIEIGEKIYLEGITSGIKADAWDSLTSTKVFLKAPITTPQGGGFKSLNVTIRKTLGLYANVRPCTSYDPFVKTKHPKMDVVIIRENEEDLYAGIEHRQTDEVYQCLKLITEPGCERIIRYAFEYAKRYGRKKVSCFSKDNIMKLTDGLFHKVFDRVAKEYPDIETDHWIIDIGAAKLANQPELFDVIVTANLYGDIISDIAAEITGSVGLGGSANIGDQCAMFEAIHGSAPNIAGQGIANPSGLILAAVMMLVHIGQADVAEKVHNAWLKTIEDGIHTPDIYQEGISKVKVDTQGFTKAVIDNLDKKPNALFATQYAKDKLPMQLAYHRKPKASKKLVGVDVFVDHDALADVNQLAQKLQDAAGDYFKLSLITNRGVKVWPNGFSQTFCVDHWRCRFKAISAAPNHFDIANLLSKIADKQIDFIKTEHLYEFDGQPGYSMGQGE